MTIRQHQTKKSRSSWALPSLIVISALMCMLLVSCSRQIIVPAVTEAPAQPHLTGKFVWYDLFTHDLSICTEFYTTLFGWTFQDTAPDNPRVKTVFRDGVPIANAVYIEPKKDKAPDSRWLGYISVKDVDKAAEVASANHGLIYIKPKDLPDRGRVAILRDPQNAIFGVVNSSAGDPPDEGAREHHWVGSELWTTDPDAALAFYTLIAGYEERLVDVSVKKKYRFLVTDDEPRAGLVKIPWDDVKPDWVPYITVRHMGETIEKAEKLGAKVLVWSGKTSKKNEVAILSDPSGAVFGLQQYQALQEEDK